MRADAFSTVLRRQFLTTYSAGGNAKKILDEWELHIVPVLNPDGYAYSHARVRIASTLDRKIDVMSTRRIACGVRIVNLSAIIASVSI